MVDYIVRKPTKEDVEYLIEHVRPEDAAELDALDGSTIRETLEQIPDLYNVSQVWVVDGKPVCIFGVTPQDGPLSTGIIWMLAADTFDKYKKTFKTDHIDYVREMIKGFGYLFNYIHAENRKSIVWLKWLGFTVLDAIPIGHKGALFHKFEMKNV